MATILLTGGGGYLGACVAAELTLRRQTFDVFSDRLDDDFGRAIEADIVIHLAGATRRRIHEVDAVNRAGVMRLLAAMRPDALILQASSRSVYGPAIHTEPVKEDHPCAPTDPYGVSKAEAEALIRARPGPYMILRLSTLIGWGIGQAGHAFHTQAGRAFVEGRPVSVFTPDRLQDGLSVRSAAAAIVDVVLGHGAGERETYNLGGPLVGVQALIEDLANAARRLNLKAEIQHQPGPPSPWPILDSAAFAARFGMPAQTEDLADYLIRGLMMERAQIIAADV